MKNYPTPHINATPSDFAKTVLMPGDPKRAKFIAENFLENAKLINDVRGVQGYMGNYCGAPVTVMASGMGMPSISIYAHELYNIFGVENIIRVGSMGGYSNKVGLSDVVLALCASTDSNMQSIYGVSGHFAPCADYDMLKIAEKAANSRNINVKCGAVLSSDNFYAPSLDSAKKWRDLGVLGVEMETAALYMTAAECQKRALSILTVSDHVFSGDSMTANERERSLTDMIEIALDTAKELAD